MSDVAAVVAVLGSIIAVLVFFLWILKVQRDIARDEVEYYRRRALEEARR